LIDELARTNDADLNSRLTGRAKPQVEWSSEIKADLRIGRCHCAAKLQLRRPKFPDGELNRHFSSSRSSSSS
jgi:hypothetical protein